MSVRIVLPLVLLSLVACHRAPATPSVAAVAPTVARDRHDPSTTPSLELELGGTHLAFQTPYIPAQCYTRTHDEGGRVHNPCYACHQEATAPNYVSDPELQLEHTLPAPARDNPWTNLFVDRRSEANQGTDAEVLAYVREDDYGIGRGGERLKRRLARVPGGWDIDDDGGWDGYVPDANFRFDARGFDVGADGTPTGWRSFAYFPFLGTFFPTNGSTDDVLIRLPEPFRTNDAGTYDALVYETNLAIVEAHRAHGALADERAGRGRRVDREHLAGVGALDDGQHEHAGRVRALEAQAGEAVVGGGHGGLRAWSCESVCQ